ncbi:MAG: hypothetical protein HOB82_08550 [Alphaproteobacteria bacterium]|jgi:hypothetical protein|nr:hypothetical protein [Alphaproteobacteria bacterium]MBT4711558.1 hypothetical protein [Alphaproteobacteria bacterium]MBT5860187.1 hypothetical protein [Alphaproteobacteria bacterium]
MRGLIRVGLAAGAALVLAAPASAQQNVRATADSMIDACSQDFYDPRRDTCEWWLRGAVEGFQAMEHNKFCFPERWPTTEAVRLAFVDWADRNPDGKDLLRTVALIATLAENYPCTG